MMKRMLTAAAGLCSGINAFTWVPQAGSYQQYVDNSTWANADMIHTTHYHVDWEVNFGIHSLEGAITHDLEVLADTDWVTMDAWDLHIYRVELMPSGSAKALRDAPSFTKYEEELMKDIVIGTELDYDVNDKSDEGKGDELYIYFPETLTKGEEVSVRIVYATSEDGQAFSWLTASQTSGGQHPYLFTQCEDINCRSVAPLMDTPANRVTYSARVITDSPLVAKMSANDTGTS